MESMVVSIHRVGSLVAWTAAAHCLYMRERQVTMHTSSILYRFIDRFITSFADVRGHSLGPFGALLGFVLGLSGWVYLFFEIFAGEAGQLRSGGSVNKYVAPSFKARRSLATRQ